MGVVRFRSGLLAQFHDAFTTRYARTGFEVYGTEGSLIATDCMTQRAIDQVLLRSDTGEEEVSLQHENLYERSLRAFHAAVAGASSPAATGEDGIRSLAIALAAREAAASGRVIAVEAGA